jgi:hypothetical protein
MPNVPTSAAHQSPCDPRKYASRRALSGAEIGTWHGTIHPFHAVDVIGPASELGVALNRCKSHYGARDIPHASDIRVTSLLPVGTLLLMVA